MPLRSILNNQNFFSDELTEENRKENYICPNCPSPLIPVIPKEEIIKHFRHKTGRSHYESESREHLAGKYKILRIAQDLGYKAETEHRIDNHITDVCIKNFDNKSEYYSPKFVDLSIEFQCSKCNSNEIIERNKTYAKNGIATLWVLGEKFWWTNRNNINRLTSIEKKISKTQDLIYYYRENFYIQRGIKYNKYSIKHHIKQMINGQFVYINGIKLCFDLGRRPYRTDLLIKTALYLSEYNIIKRLIICKEYLTIIIENHLHLIEDEFLIHDDNYNDYRFINQIKLLNDFIGEIWEINLTSERGYKLNYGVHINQANECFYYNRRDHR